MNEASSTNKQQKGGHARAKSLSSKERSDIAKAAANERWNSDLPIAINEGELKVAGLELSSVVLPDETRVISQTTFLSAIGRSRSFRGGTGITSTAGEIPFFLQSKAFKQYSGEIEAMPAKPIHYRTKNGRKAIGYNALLLPAVAELYLKLRDDKSANGHIPERLIPYIKASDILIRGLANVGIIALVDEATGYQDSRTKDALAKILEKFVAKELQPYVKTFPIDFYKQLFRLRGLEYSAKPPRYFGHLTNDIIYARLAPGVIEELRRKSERDKRGNLKKHLHRQLTRDFGHPALREHLASVVTLMKVSKNYDEFYKHLEDIHQKYNTNLKLPLDEV